MKKNPIFKKCLSAMLLLGAAAMPLSAAVDDEAKVVSETDDTKVVEICGLGLTEKSAIKDATRNAVSFVVAQLADAKTIAQHEDKIEDQIVSSFNGFTDAVQTIEGPESRDGSVCVRVRATVKSGLVKADIERFGKESMDFNPSAAKAALEAKISSDEDARNFVLNAWDTYVKLFKFDLIKYEAKLGEEPMMKVTVKMSLNSKDFRNVLLKSVRKTMQTLKISSDSSGSGDRFEIYLPALRDYSLECYRLDEKFPEWKKDAYKKLPTYYLVVECIGDDGDLVAWTREPFANDDIPEYPFSNKMSTPLGSFYSISPRDGDGNFFTSKTFDTWVRLLSEDDFKEVRSVRVSVEKALPNEKK